MHISKIAVGMFDCLSPSVGPIIWIITMMELKMYGVTMIF